MSANPKDWLNTIESMLSKPLISGVVLFILALTVETLHSSGRIDPNDIGSWLLPLARIIGAISYFLIALGILYALTDVLKILLTWSYSKWSSRSANKEELKRLIENANRLSPNAKAMLKFYMDEPSGRFLSPEWGDAFDELCTADLVEGEESESDSAYGIYTIHSSFAGKPYRVNRLYYRNMKN